MKNWFKKSFKFSNSEEKGRIALLFLFWVFFAAVLTKVYWYPSSTLENSTELELIYIDTLIADVEENQTLLKEINIINLETFNPNTVDEEFLVKINMPNNLVRNWVKYLKSGGVFYKVEDIKRLYGMNDVLYNKLKPFVQIPEKPNSKKTSFTKIEQKNHSFTTLKLSLNTSDSASFTRVKGIGPTYASRIVKYRDALGGFVSAHQLFEVYGIDSLMLINNLDVFEIDSNAVQRININTVQFKTLLKHPYFDYKHVKSIVNYRKQHGNYQSTSDLLKIVVLDSIWLRKVEPYITVE